MLLRGKRVLWWSPCEHVPIDVVQGGVAKLFRRSILNRKLWLRHYIPMDMHWLVNVSINCWTLGTAQLNLQAGVSLRFMWDCGSAIVSRIGPFSLSWEKDTRQLYGVIWTTEKYYLGDVLLDTAHMMALRVSFSPVWTQTNWPEKYVKCFWICLFSEVKKCKPLGYDHSLQLQYLSN